MGFEEDFLDFDLDDSSDKKKGNGKNYKGVDFTGLNDLDFNTNKSMKSYNFNKKQNKQLGTIKEKRNDFGSQSDSESDSDSDMQYTNKSEKESQDEFAFNNDYEVFNDSTSPKKQKQKKKQDDLDDFLSFN